MGSPRKTLVAGLAEGGAVSPACTEESKLTPNRLGVVRGQRGLGDRYFSPTDRYHVRTGRGKRHRRKWKKPSLLVGVGHSEIARGDEDRHALLRRSVIELVEISDRRGSVKCLLGGAKAVGPDVSDVVGERPCLGVLYVLKTLDALGLRYRNHDQRDVGARGHGVCPLDVKRRLVCPTELVADVLVVNANRAGQVVVVEHDVPLGLVDHERRRGWQAVSRVKCCEVLPDRRAAERVKDDDGLPGAVMMGRVLRHEVVL